MDDQEEVVYFNKDSKRSTDNETRDKIVNTRREQLSSKNKQLAQDRLKRLQTKLKLINKKPDNERLVPKRSTRHTSSNASNSHRTIVHPHNVSTVAVPVTPPSRIQERLKFLSFSDRPNRETIASSSSSGHKRRSVPSSRHNSEINAWAKPKALLDASNRLKSGHSTISANQRMSLLRESLQQMQKDTNSKSTLINKISANINNNELPSQSKILPGATAGVQEPLKPDKLIQLLDKKPPIDDIEPMDIDMDFEEPQLEEKGKKEKKSGNNAKLAFNEREKSDKTLLKLLSAGQELPKRLEDHMYFVLDTNVLIDNLAFVEDLSRVALGDTNGSMLYVPYIVIKELDKLKDRRNEDDYLKRAAAIRAIHYLNNKFDDSLKIQAQSAMEEAEHLIEVDAPDDSIINCCMQLATQVPNLMLLTNDNNLRLKAKASSILVSCRSDLLNDFRDQFDALPS